jgi:hypothetical protein
MASTMPSQTKTAAIANRQLASTAAAYDSTPRDWARAILGSDPLLLAFVDGR